MSDDANDDDLGGFGDDFDENDFGDDAFGDDDFDEAGFDEPFGPLGEGPLPEDESWQVTQDLDDLDAFEQVFAEEGLKGVSMFCRDCDEEHFYRWDLLRNSLELLLETGEIPVHEPAFQPDPDEYIPWEYARGYVDALRDVGVDKRAPVDVCPRCGLPLDEPLSGANWCPRCATPLLGPRLAAALEEAGMSPAAIDEVLRAAGLPSSR